MLWWSAEWLVNFFFKEYSKNQKSTVWVFFFFFSGEYGLSLYKVIQISQFNFESEL